MRVNPCKKYAEKNKLTLRKRKFYLHKQNRDIPISDILRKIS